MTDIIEVELLRMRRITKCVRHHAHLRIEDIGGISLTR